MVSNMDYSSVLTIVGSNLVLMGTTLALFLWTRTEASQDRRDMMQIIRAIEKEMRDFHSCLLLIEKERK